jgi:hypothetical protein
VWQTLSGAQHIITSTPFVYTLYAILLAIAQHLVYLAFNFTVVWCARECLRYSYVPGS